MNQISNADARQQERRNRVLVAASAAYIVIMLLANLGSLRILALGGFSLDGGSLLYPLSFTLRDLLHKKTGAQNTRFVILLAAAANLVLFGFVYLVSQLPYDPEVGLQAAYGQVLNPGIRLVAGSIAAMTVAELLDTAIYSLLRRRFGQRRQWLRVLGSNLISVPTDTAIFLLIAFSGLMPMAVILSMFWANLIIKYLVSLLSFGSIYLIKEDRA